MFRWMDWWTDVCVYVSMHAFCGLWQYMVYGIHSSSFSYPVHYLALSTCYSSPQSRCNARQNIFRSFCTLYHAYGIKFSRPHQEKTGWYSHFIHSKIQNIFDYYTEIYSVKVFLFILCTVIAYSICWLLLLIHIYAITIENCFFVNAALGYAYIDKIWFSAASSV